MLTTSSRIEVRCLQLLFIVFHVLLTLIVFRCATLSLLNQDELSVSCEKAHPAVG
jgi:hypothetical protein